MKLTDVICRFFDQYLARMRAMSLNTIQTYRQTFSLLLPFAATYHETSISSLTIDHLSADMMLSFLDHLEQTRNNIARTRNLRLAAVKSFAKMIRLMYPEQKDAAQAILRIPKKRAQKLLVGYMTPQEILKVFNTVDLTQQDGFRDYTILHLLFDSGARASEVATLNLDYFNPENASLSILGKGNRYRIVCLWPKTVSLIEKYIEKYRISPKIGYRHRLFINQRREEMTRHGIYRLCRKHLCRALPDKRVKDLNPVHSFRHSCAVNLLISGCSLTDIKNHLGHENLGSTMVYLHLDLSRRREIQKKFMEYTQSSLTQASKIDELIDWENKQDTLSWLDSL
jgi:site-specific recombinase XerD